MILSSKVGIALEKKINSLHTMKLERGKLLEIKKEIIKENKSVEH
jgi:hypothetical protein